MIAQATMARHGPIAVVRLELVVAAPSLRLHRVRRDTEVTSDVLELRAVSKAYEHSALTCGKGGHVVLSTETLVGSPPERQLMQSESIYMRLYTPRRKRPASVSLPPMSTPRLGSVLVC